MADNTSKIGIWEDGIRTKWLDDNEIVENPDGWDEFVFPDDL